MLGRDADARAAIAEFSIRARQLDVSQSCERELKAVLKDLRTAQRCLEGLIIQAGTRANALAATGRSAPASEMMRADGVVGSGQARREAARVAAASSMPGLCDPVAAGEISGEHVDVLARHTKDLDDAQREALDSGALIDRAKNLPPEMFRRLVKRTVEMVTDEHGLVDTLAKQAASEFRHWFDGEAGMGRFSGSLDRERYEMLVTAVEAKASALAAAGGVVKGRNLSAQALVELLAGPASGRLARIPSVTVLVDHKTMVDGPHAASVRQTEAGHDIALSSLARICCDAVIRRVTMDDNGVPIDVGRKHRTATDAQWAALKAMHSSCAWDGCQAPIGWCQAHHIVEWEHGGHTDLDNLVPLCSSHHHRVHEGGWRIRLASDRRLVISKPNGTHHVTVPRPSRC